MVAVSDTQDSGCVGQLVQSKAQKQLDATVRTLNQNPNGPSARLPFHLRQANQISNVWPTASVFAALNTSHFWWFWVEQL